MISVSSEFKTTMQERTDYKESAIITFSDGTVLELESGDFSISNNNLSDAAGNSSFPLGVAVEKVIQIELINDDDHLSDYDFYGAEIQLFLNFELSETTETVDYGVYTVIEPETYGETVIIQAADNMYLADADYSTSLAFPATLREIVQDSCSTTGIYLLTTTFTNDDFEVQEAPEGLTHRQVLAMAAMLAGGFARMDYKGRLCIKGFDTSIFDESAGLNGGVFDGDSPYSSGDSADGGSFNPWDTGDEYDGGLFADMNDYHTLTNFSTLKIETDDVVITGIQTTVDDVVYLSGDAGYVLSIDNSLISGQEQEAVDLIGELLIGVRFRPFEGDHIGYPIAEFGDVALITDRKGNAYQTILTDINFVFFGYTTFKCSSESPLRNSSSYASQLTKAVVTARKNAAAQITEYDKAVQMLTSLITNSFGVYKTEDVLEDGSTIYYLHDQPTLTESTTIWMMTADAFAVSTDGGETWNAGFDSEGNAVVNVLSAIGINFSWAKGGTLTLGGEDNTYGTLKILDADGNEIGVWDKDGISASNVTLDGTLTSSSGKLMSALYSGNLRFYYNDDFIGQFSSNYWSGDPSIRGISMDTTANAQYMAFSHDSNEDGIYESTFLINYGLNPDGYEEKVIFYTKSRFLGTIYGVEAVFDGTTSSGGIKITRTTGGAQVNIVNDYASGRLCVSTTGRFGLYDVTNSMWLIYTLDGVRYIPPSHLTSTLIFPNGYGLLATDLSGGTAYVLSITTADLVCLGSNSYDTYIRGSGITSAVAITTSSDARLKTDFAALESYSGVFDALVPLAFRYTNNPGKIHFGFTTQDTEKALEDSGYDADDYAILGSYKDEESGETYGALGYTEIIALLVNEVQTLKKEVQTLKAEMQELKNNTEAGE